MTKHPLTVPPGQVIVLLLPVTLDQIASKVSKLDIGQRVGTTLRERNYVINALPHEIGSFERKINQSPTQATMIISLRSNLIKGVQLMPIAQDQGSTSGVVSPPTSFPIKLEGIKDPASVGHVKA